MKITTFAAIYIGSYEVNLKIFEISAPKKVRQIDFIRSRIELGKDVYSKGNIGYEAMEDLCGVLKEYCRFMDGYQVDDYRAYASNVIRDAKNGLFILEQIRLRTNIKVSVLSNSEHRSISYKSIASHKLFHKIIHKGAAVVDIGGGSIQITLFKNGNAVTTQHIVLGTVRIHEKLSVIAPIVTRYEEQIEELVDKEIKIFNRLYLPEKKIPYIIMTGNYIVDIVKNTIKNQDGTINRSEFLKTLEKLNKKSKEQIAEELHLSNEKDPLLIPSVVLYKRVAELLNAEQIWVSGANISDGIAYHYGEKKKILKAEHDFEQDVLSAARNIAHRYESYSQHTAIILDNSSIIFDAMKKVHGLSKRDKLLLQVAAILHDCGRYISLVNQAECSYQIIMSSEIIGISHLEREIVASAVKYNEKPLPPFDQLIGKMNRESYMIVSKLAAILKIANALDRSHKQKCKKLKAVLREKSLILTMESSKDLLLEKGLFISRTDLFEEIFSIKPVIKEKRVFD